MQVGAAGRLANRVKTQSPQFRFQSVHFVRVSRALAEPFGETGAGERARFDLDQGLSGIQISIFA